jgi:branched-chain amino acid transport system permease protein
MRKSKLFLLLFLIVLAIFPLVIHDDYFINLGVMILYYAFVSQAWNILSGFSGQFSFGHAAFFGTGAYTSSLLLTKFGVTPWLGMILGFIIAALIGLMIGFLSFRYKLRGVFFSLGTLAFAEILRIVVQNFSFFNKTMGVLIPLDAHLLKFQFSSKTGYYYTIFIFTILVTLLVYYISRSRLGYNLIAIRENEDAAQSLGVNTYKNKMIAIAISAGLTAVGGTFYAQYLLFVEPSTTLDSNVSINILLPAIIGGAGTVLGPIIGAFITIPIGEITTALFGNFVGVNLMVYGVILVLVILYLPEGIVGWFQGKMKTKERKKKIVSYTAAELNGGEKVGAFKN